MNPLRTNSLDIVLIDHWRWQPFLEETIKYLERFNLQEYPISSDFLDKEVFLKKKRNSMQINSSTWACKTNKIRKARAVCLEAENVASVFNLVISPSNEFDLPFFGADFVTLPNGHLLALDLQPALKNDIQHTQEVWRRLIPIHQHWQSLLPYGGTIPTEAEPYFSPGFLWTRVPLGKEGDEIISRIIRPAFIEYLDLYCDLLSNANKVTYERSLTILEGQKAYMNYREDNDPARPMLNRFFGKEWTDLYIKNVLFNI